MNKRSVGFLLGALVLAGAAMRVWQYREQVLLDDEWHAIHQLLGGKSPGELFLSLGHADYSIPLGLLYWLEMRWFGLSEWAMRWPMLLAGLATLVLLPLWAWRRFSARVTIIFAALLVASPLLVIYTHTARPYALTLLLGLLALHAFERWVNGARNANVWALTYVCSFALCAWLHAITAPLLAAPLVWEGARHAWGREGVGWRALLAVSAGALVFTALLVLPPLLADPSGMALKTGEASITGATLWGALHSWFGTGHSMVALALIALAAYGLGPLWRAEPITRYLLLGLCLTVLVILVLRPASVNHPLTFGRYLLPALPLLLLAVACGVSRALARTGESRAFAAALAVLPILYIGTSPLQDLLAFPNSHVTHSRFQYDFRPDHNRIAQYQRATLPESAFWRSLADAPAGSLLVTAAPFYFETYHWDGPRWERSSGQRVRPAFLTGFCADQRFGEVPYDGRFPLRNAYWLSRITSRQGPLPDWLVFTKPVPRFAGTPEGEEMRAAFERCSAQLQSELGQADFEDEALLAWRITKR